MFDIILYATNSVSRLEDWRKFTVVAVVEIGICMDLWCIMMHQTCAEHPTHAVCEILSKPRSPCWIPDSMDFAASCLQLFITFILDSDLSYLLILTHTYPELRLINAYRGDVIKFSGDALMIYFPASWHCKRLFSATGKAAKWMPTDEVVTRCTSLYCFQIRSSCLSCQSYVMS